MRIVDDTESAFGMGRLDALRSLPRATVRSRRRQAVPFLGQLTDDLGCVGHVDGLLADALLGVCLNEDSHRDRRSPSIRRVKPTDPVHASLHSRTPGPRR